MKIVVTGGAGFIGVHTAARFAAQGHAVWIVDNLSRPGSEHNLRWVQARHANVRWVRCDVARESAVLKGALEDAEVVFHLAGQVAVTTSVQNPRLDFETNARGTLNVLEAVRRKARRAFVVYSSTNKVYGDLAKIPINTTSTRYVFQKGRQGVSEDQLLDFYSPYGCSKGAADQYVHDYHRIYGLQTLVLRQSCIYGQRQFGNEDQGWLAWFAVATLLKRDVTIYGNGKQVRDVLYVDDLIDAYVLAVKRRKTLGGTILNIGGGPANTMSLLELLVFLEAHFKRPIKPTFEKERPGDQRIYISDLTLARKKLGWIPKTNVSKGLQSMLAWIAENETLIRKRLGKN